MNESANETARPGAASEPLGSTTRYLRGVDERHDAVETTPWIRDEQREACHKYLAEEALSALDQVPADVIAESWRWYVTYGERGRVEELHDVRGLGVAGVPEGGRYD